MTNHLFDESIAGLTHTLIAAGPFGELRSHEGQLLIPVEPVMQFSMADPRIVEPIDVLSTIDKRPNLMELTPTTTRRGRSGR